MRRSNWPVVGFADILERVDRKVTVDDTQTYECVGVRWYGLGTFIRESKLGVDIRRKQQWIIREGDVVYNKLFAWKGAFAIANGDVDGCIVSDKFPTYRLDEDQVDSRYLRYYFRSEFIARQAQDLSKGAAAISKLTLNPPDFWKLTIPLPKLDDQRRIVSRIEELAALIEEAQELRALAREEARRIVRAVLATTFAGGEGSGWAKATLGDDSIAEVIMGQSPPSSTYNDVGQGLPFYQGKADFGALYPTPRKWCSAPHKVAHQDDVLISVRAPVGPTNLCVQESCIGRGLAAVRPTKKLHHKFLLYYLRLVEPALSGEGQGSTFTAIAKRVLTDLEIPLPELEVQRQTAEYLDSIYAQLDELTVLQNATQGDLAALLPSVLDRAFREEL